MGTTRDITFKAALEKLGMDGNTSSSIYFVAEKDKEKNPDLYLALEFANEFKATAVYFRFYNDGRPPRPQIYIYDNSDFTSVNISGADVHHNLWNAGIVPFCFIFNKSQIQIYNCAKKPEWDNDGESFTTSPHDLTDLLSVVTDKPDNYNIRQFDSGLFWDSKAGQGFKYEEGAYEQLLTQLKNVKENIISRVGSEQLQHSLWQKFMPIITLI